MTVLRPLLRAMAHPLAVFVGIACGVTLGVLFPTFSKALSVPADAYLAALQMTVVPILVTALVSSVGRMLQNGKAGKAVGSLVTLIVANLFLVAGLGLLMGLVLQPGNGLGDAQSTGLGRLVVDHSMSDGAGTGATGLAALIGDLVPDNIFASLTDGRTLGVLFFAILFAIALGTSRGAGGRTVIEICDATYEALCRVMDGVMALLPLGLASLFAVQVATAGLETMFAMAWFIITCYVGVVILIIIYGLVMARARGVSLFHALWAMRRPLFISFGASSSLAAVPPTIDALEKIGVPRQTSNLALPIGLSLNPAGSVLHFAVAALFFSQLYGETVTLSLLPALVLAAIAAGVAGSSAPGLGALSMIGLVLAPLGLPASTALPLLIAVDPLVDPALSAAGTQSNAAITTVVSRSMDSEVPPERQTNTESSG